MNLHKPPTVTLPAARRIALAAQGFLEPPPVPGRATARQINRVLQRLGVVQIDSVNALTRSHYLPFFSRLGPYDPAILDSMRDKAPRKVIEYWAHEASLLPVSTWPLFRFRMERAKREAWGSIRRIQHEQPELVAVALQEIRARGPITARQCEAALTVDLPKANENWGWNWSAVKTALEYLFWAGEITSAGRTPQFERRYAVPERVIPATLVQADAVDAQRAHLELVRIAARAHGIATARCLRDYFRLNVAETKSAIATLVANGELEPVQVPGWTEHAYLHAGARRPRSAHVEALLSPFDSLVWQRERTEALFDMRLRLEIYTPADKRIHGYYVLPFLYGDTLMARVDLKADRAAGVLRVQRCTWEPQAAPEAATALDRQLVLMAQWLGLESVMGGTG